MTRNAQTPAELAAVLRPSLLRLTRTIRNQRVDESVTLTLRSPHATDRRQVVVAVTDGGRALLARERRERDAWLSTRLAMVTPAERDLLARVAPLLDKLAAL